MKLPFLPNHDDASFFSFLTRQHPELTPGGRRSPELPSVVHEPVRPVQPVTVPQATTVLAVKYQDGVVIAGDRRATEGFQIAERRIEKVFKIDDYSAMAIAGVSPVSQKQPVQIGRSGLPPSNSTHTFASIGGTAKMPALMPA